MEKILKSKEFWALFEKALKLLSTFIFIFFISSKVEENAVGQFFLIESTLFVSIIVIYFGTDSIANKFFVDYPNDCVFKYLIKIRFTIYLFVLMFYISTISFYKLNINTSVIAIGLICSIFIPFNIYEQYNYYKGNYLAVYKFKVFLVALSILIKVISYNTYYFIELMLFTLFLETIPISFLYVINYKKDYLKTKIVKLSTEQKSNVLRNAAPAFLASLSVLIYSRIDQFMLASISEISDVAKYGILVKLSDSFVFIPVLVGSLYLPKAYKNKFSRSFSINYFRLIVILSFLSFFLSIILYAIYIVYNKENALDFNSVVFYQCSVLLNFIGTAVSQFQVYSGNGILRLMRIIVGMFTNVLLNFLMIEDYGVLGCIISTVIALLISNVIFLIFTRDRIYIFQFVYALCTINKFSYYKVNCHEHV